MDCPKKGGMVAGLPDDPLVEILSAFPSSHSANPSASPRHDAISSPTPSTGDRVGGGDGDGVDGGNGSSGDGENVSGQLVGGEVVYSNGRGTGRFIDLSGRSMPLVDPSFTFMMEVPDIEDIRLLHGSNGLLLFRYDRNPHSSRSLGYIVCKCNPTTKEWVAVPNSGWNSDSEVEDEDEDEEGYATVDNWVGVLTYSSDTGVWTDGASEQPLETVREDQELSSFRTVASWLGSAVLEGMQHLIVFHM
ncbi:hypothetical protein EJB05_14709, partial [Eragrostis curvula]